MQQFTIHILQRLRAVQADLPGHSRRLLGWHEATIAELAAEMVAGATGLEGSSSTSFSDRFCKCLHRSSTFI